MSIGTCSARAVCLAKDPLRVISLSFVICLSLSYSHLVPTFLKKLRKSDRIDSCTEDI